jgi:hypothetical protein
MGNEEHLARISIRGLRVAIMLVFILSYAGSRPIRIPVTGCIAVPQTAAPTSVGTRDAVSNARIISIAWPVDLGRQDRQAPCRRLRPRRPTDRSPPKA